jgi:hypothetical protein
MAWRRLAAACAACSLSAAAFAACSDAHGTVSGGEPRFDASPEGAFTDTGVGCTLADANADVGSGHAWTDLYRDYFGPTGKASCAGDGTCHGDKDQEGAVNSGYVCGHDADTCYTGITSPSAGLVMVGDTTTDPKSTTLYAILRKKCGGGIMPRKPAYAFDAPDIQRIVDWLRAGAPKN